MNSKTVTLESLKKRRKEILKNFGLGVKLVGIPAPYVSYAVINFTKFTGNQVTGFWVLLEAIGISMFALGNHLALILGFFLIHIAHSLDQVDGDVAIARGTSGPNNFGMFLDKGAEAWSRSFVFITVSFGLFLSGAGGLIMLVGSLTSLFFALSPILDNKINLKPTIKERQEEKKPRNTALDFLRPIVPFNILYLSLLFGLAGVATYLIYFYFIISVGMFAARIERAWRNLE